MNKTLLIVPFLYLYNPISELHCRWAYKSQVEVREVKYRGQSYGHSLWMNRKTGKIQANYIINKQSDSAYKQYHRWKSEKDIVLSCTAGMVNEAFYNPVGLSIDHGKVINNSLYDKMEGLVVLLNGVIEIYNINQTIGLESLGHYLNLNIYNDKYQFVEWAKERGATVFQTHLLAYENHLTIGTNANTKLAMRKFLVLLSDTNGVLFYTIYYINKKAEPLYLSSKYIFDYLIEKKYKVHAMVNLDTGIHDIMYTNESLKTCDNKAIKNSTGTIKEATNLLSFFYLKQ